MPPRGSQIVCTVMRRGRDRGHEVVEDAIRHILVERPFVAVGPEIELEGLELHDRLVGNVFDAHGREVGLPRHGAEARELGRLTRDDVVATGVRVRHRTKVA